MNRKYFSYKKRGQFHLTFSAGELTTPSRTAGDEPRRAETLQPCPGLYVSQRQTVGRCSWKAPGKSKGNRGNPENTWSIFMVKTCNNYRIFSKKHMFKLL